MTDAIVEVDVDGPFSLISLHASGFDLLVTRVMAEFALDIRRKAYEDLGDEGALDLMNLRLKDRLSPNPIETFQR